MRIRERFLPYGVAIGLTAIALLLTLWVEPFVLRTIGAFFYITIIVSAWYGGFRPGSVAVVLSTLAISYFFIPPRYQLWFERPEDVFQLAMFLLVAFTINLLTSNFQDSKQKIERLGQKLATENAEQLRMALSAAQMGMWNWEMATGEINWSPEHDQLFGLTPGTFDGKSETFNACLHPDDRETVNQAVQQALQTMSSYHCEFRVVWADGSIHWIEGRGQAFYNEAGQPVRMTGTVMAIDERKQAQGLLEQQFEQQRLVMEVTQRIRRSLNLQNILQTTVDEVRQFLECDRVTIFQFSPGWGGAVVVESVADEWMAILPLQIYDPCIGEEYVEPFKQGLVTAKADIYTAGISPCHVEFLAQFQVRANLVVPIMKGDELWGLLAAHHCAAPRQWQSSEIDLLRQLAAQVSVALGQSALFEQVQTELAERKQAEAALRQSEERFRHMADNAPVMIWVTDATGYCTYLSKSWYNFTGQTEATGLGFGWLDVVHPEDFGFSRDAFLKATEQHETFQFEYRLRRQDGEYRWAIDAASPWFGADGQFQGFIGSVLDISDRKRGEAERKRAEIALVQLNAELEQRVANRTAAVTEVNDRLLEALMEQQRTQLILLEQAQLLDLAHDTILTRSLNGVITFWNEGAEQMYGWTKAEALGQQIHTFLQPQFPKPLAEIESELLERGYWEGELIHTRRDNSTITVASRWVMQKDQMGRPIKVLEINNDITLQKQAEVALSESEERRRLALDLTHLGFWDMHLPSGNIIWNDNHFTLLGLDLYDIEPSYELWRSHVHPDDVGWVEQRFLESIENHTDYTAEYRVVHRDGSVHWFMARARATYDDSGQPLRSLGVLLDSSDRKRIEEALQQSEEKFRQLAENIQAVFWMIDAQTQQVLYLSKAYETIWLMSSESVFQNHSNWLEAIHPDDRPHLETVFFELKKTGQYDEQYRIIRPDGSIRWIRDRAFPIKNDAGELVRVAGIAEDITEQQKIEQMKSEFIGIVSHELRTPLTAIKMSLGLLKTGIYDKKPDKFQRMLDIALIDTNRLVNLVNDILDLERLDSGRAILEKTPCQAADLMQQAVNGVEALATPQHITLAIAPTDAKVWAAADAIIQTLTNLLSNAIKFSPPNSTITLSAECQTGVVLFRVSDRGRGIPADKLEAIFGRFQQVDASDSRQKGGTGLGLAICRSIIGQHGGQIWAQSTPGAGSTFFFTLPLPPEEL